jgi:hypothetical protein
MDSILNDLGAILVSGMLKGTLEKWGPRNWVSSSNAKKKLARQGDSFMANSNPSSSISADFMDSSQMQPPNSNSTRGKSWTQHSFQHMIQQLSGRKSFGQKKTGLSGRKSFGDKKSESNMYVNLSSGNFTPAQRSSTNLRQAHTSDPALPIKPRFAFGSGSPSTVEPSITAAPPEILKPSIDAIQNQPVPSEESLSFIPAIHPGQPLSKVRSFDRAVVLPKLVPRVPLPAPLSQQ